MKKLMFCLALALSGCVTAEGSFASKGLDRAAFDLGCPKEQVQTAVLVRNDGLGCEGSQVGATGCGKKATYVCKQQEWLLNSPISDGAAAPSAPAAAPEATPASAQPSAK